MLNEIFYWILNMSISATLIGLIILILRSIKGIPRRIFVLFWLVPFLRMTVPIGLNFKYSLMTLISKFTTKTVVVYEPANHIVFSMANFSMLAEEYFPIKYKINILESVFNVASAVWIMFFFVIIFTLAVLCFAMLHEMKDAEPSGGRIYYSEKITSPAVYGIFKPKIIVPISYKNTDIKYILLHERAHIKRLDNLWRIVAFIVTAVHWFNPFAWVMLKLFLSDLELACDESAVKSLSDTEIKEYALSIVNAKQSKNVFISAFGGAKIRTRIENILSFKKLTFFSATAFAVLITVIFTVLLTNAK